MNLFEKWEKALEGGLKRLDAEAGWYRLYDGSSRFGTRICRNNRILESRAERPGRGAGLRRPDEVHLGQARMGVDISGDCWIWPERIQRTQGRSPRHLV